MESTARKVLLVINDGPYGSERPFNALRLAMQLAKQPDVAVRVFLVGDGVQCAVSGQETHEGFYNVERMMTALVRAGEVAT
ncbi:MAG TPA: DsrE family protein [Anaerolineales bacterium]|nr:DsrE family protein [Anaerolineales bacterium]